MTADRRLRILHVEDDPKDAELLRAAVEAQGLVVEWVHVDRVPDFEHALSDTSFDLILSDYTMPSFDGLQALKLARTRLPDVPFIFVSGTIGEERAVDALLHGATDYVLKDRPARLVPAIQRALRDTAHRTQRRQVEERLGATYRQLQRLLAASPTIIYSALPTGGREIMFVSDNVRARLGYEPEQLTGPPGFWLSCVHPEDRADVLALRDRLDDRGVLRYRFLHADGTYRWIEDQTNVIRNPEGDPTEIVGSWIDVTYLKIMADEKDRLQEQFHQAQKMEAIGALAGGVAHDFSNILMAILSYSESLLMQLPEDSSLRHEAQEIRRAGNRAAALTHQLLAFSRKQATSPQLLNPAEAVRSLSRMISRLIGDNIVVSLDLHTDAGYILCDPTHLDQVLINLILNARDAMPQGGKITVGVREAADGTQDNGFCLWVADTGVGIPPENVARIFDPFFTTKPQGKGTGLGLATVYGVVKQNGGRIEVESHPEVGTTFRIFFARHTAAALDAAATPHGTASATRALTVLLAEDNEPVRNATARLLVGLGHVVVAVESGERAREVFSGKPDSIDLLVSDVVMPGMGGAELLRELRALRPELRAVFCTGYPDDLDLLEREHTTTEPVVHKPFDRETLARAIRTALAGPPVG